MAWLTAWSHSVAGLSHWEMKPKALSSYECWTAGGDNRVHWKASLAWTTGHTREGTPEGDSHRGAAVPLGHLWRLFSPQGGPPARTRKSSSLWPACEEDCPFVVLNHGTELPGTVGTGSSALRGRADCHGGAQAGGGTVIQHLLSTYYVLHTAWGLST